VLTHHTALESLAKGIKKFTPASYPQKRQFQKEEILFFQAILINPKPTGTQYLVFLEPRKG
jgi:hypothetical protein